MLRYSKPMKQKAKTTVMRILRSGIVVSAAVVFALVSSGIVAAVDYRAQIEALNNQIAEYEAQADALHDHAASLQAALDGITAEKNALQAQIDLNTVKVEQLTTEIAANEAKLERQKQSLSKTIAQIYVNGSTSPIEILASSKSVGDYVSSQEVRNSVRNQMKLAMDEVKRLRQELEDQKKAVEDLLATQRAQREQLAQKEQEQASLVAKTRGEEAAYQALVTSLEDQRAAAEAALAASLSSGSYKIAPAGFVKSGGIVGGVGNTGLSTGAHLHLEVRSGGSVTNPSPYIQTQPIDMPPGYISQPYGNPDGMYRSGYHPGTDYATYHGAPIYAIDSGNLYRGCSDQMLGTYGNPYGYVAIVEHANGTLSVYAHMTGGPAACDYNTYY